MLGAGPDTLSGSRWAWRQGHKAGAPPALDLAAHRAVCDLVRDLVADGLVLGVKDTADGGLGVALAEMVAASGVGAIVRAPEGADHRWVFGETPSRFVLAVDPAAVAEVHRRHTAAGVAAALVGEAGGDRLAIEGLAGGANVDAPVERVVAALAWCAAVPARPRHHPGLTTTRFPQQFRGSGPPKLLWKTFGQGRSADEGSTVDASWPRSCGAGRGCAGSPSVPSSDRAPTRPASASSMATSGCISWTIFHITLSRTRNLASHSTPKPGHLGEGDRQRPCPSGPRRRPP